MSKVESALEPAIAYYRRPLDGGPIALAAVIEADRLAVVRAVLEYLNADGCLDITWPCEHPEHQPKGLLAAITKPD